MSNEPETSSRKAPVQGDPTDTILSDARKGSRVKESILTRHTWQTLWAAFFLALMVLGAVTGQGLVTGFGVMGLVAGAISVAWNRLALEKLSYERHLPARFAFTGEEISMTLALSNKKPLPLTWVRLEDEIPDELEVVSGDTPWKFLLNVQTLRHRSAIKWYERLRWEYRLRCTKRGLFRLGPASIQSGDPFGFLRSMVSEPRQDTLVVYPQVVPLEELGIPAARPLGEIRGGLRIFQDPTRLAGLRDYERGDPFKIIDWKATARVQQLQVRTFEPSTSTTVILVVAVDTRSPFWETFAPEVLERVLIAAASVARYAAEKEYTIGLLTNDLPVPAGQTMTVPPATDRDQLALVLGALATVRPYAFEAMYDRLGTHSRQFPLGATLAVATAFMPPEFVDVLGDLKDRGHKIAVFYVGEEPCPELAEGIVLHELRDHLVRMEETGEILAG